MEYPVNANIHRIGRIPKLDYSHGTADKKLLFNALSDVFLSIQFFSGY